MTLKASSVSLFFSALFFLPICVKADQKDVTVTFPGGITETGTLHTGQGHLYLEGDNGQYYPLSPQQSQINKENQEINQLKAEQENLKEEREREREREHFEDVQLKMSEEKTCQNLLFNCQVPNHTKQACENFVAECNTVKPVWRMYVKSEPVAKPLDKTILREASGFMLPSGQVLNAYYQPLGYVTPQDMNSALTMARAAHMQNNAMLPASFPKSSPQHPYRATANASLQSQEKARHTDSCLSQLRSCLVDLLPFTSYFYRQLPSSCINFKKECPEFPPLPEVIQKISGDAACKEYQSDCTGKISANTGDMNQPQIPTPDTCHKNLKLCNRDPASAPPIYSPETDCPMDNLICSSFDGYIERLEACQRFKIHQCARHDFNFSKKKKSSFKPFWAKDTDSSLIETPQKNWTSCAVDGNVLFVASDKLFSLGRLSDNGSLSLYQEGKIFKDVARVSPEGKLLKKSKESHDVSNGLQDKQIQKLVSHFSYIGRIASDGTVWACSNLDAEKRKHLKNILFLDGEVAFRKNAFIERLTELQFNTHYYRASRTLNEADMRMMQKENMAQR